LHRIFAWTTAAENYELYLEDAKMSDRDTYWQPETIMKVAESLMK
jgi:hypothetical protein